MEFQIPLARILSTRSSAPAIVILPRSNPATTVCRPTASNSNFLGVHFVGSGDFLGPRKSCCSTFSEAVHRCTYIGAEIQAEIALFSITHNGTTLDDMVKGTSTDQRDITSLR